MCECCWIGLALSHLPDATDKPSPLFTEWFSSTSHYQWRPRPHREFGLVGFPSQPSRRGGVSDYCCTLCRVVLPSRHRGERSAPHWHPSRSCHQAAGPVHPADHSPESTRPVEDPPGIFRQRHQPWRYWLLLSKMGDKWSNPPPNISIAFEGKTHRLSLLRLRHVEAYGIAFLTELFNLSGAGFEIPEIWKNSSLLPSITTLCQLA